MIKIKIRNIQKEIIIDDDKKDCVVNKNWRFLSSGKFVTNIIREGKRTVATIQQTLFPEYTNKHLLHKNGNFLDWRKSNLILKTGIEEDKKVELLEKRKKFIEDLN